MIGGSSPTLPGSCDGGPELAAPVLMHPLKAGTGGSGELEAGLPGRRVAAPMSHGRVAVTRPQTLVFGLSAPKLCRVDTCAALTVRG